MMLHRLLLLLLTTNSIKGLLQLQISPTARRTPFSSSKLYSSSDHIDHNGKIKNSNTPQRVGIVGAGAIALGTAALLEDANHSPMLWSPSGRPLETQFTRTGAVPEETFSCRIASSAQELAQENNVIILALPANGHKQVLDAIAPHLRESQHHVIISSHASMGALYLANLLQQYQPNNCNIPITAWGTTVVTARQPNPQTVRINTVRKSVDYCTIPPKAPSSSLLSSLFPNIKFAPRPGLLAITLSNLNPQNHLGIALGNISRMDQQQQWYQSQNITPRIGQFLQDLDRERLDICQALGFEGIKTIHEHFSWSFHVPLQESVSDMCQEIYAKGNDVLGPDTADSRYVTEDVPFGLPLTVVLGDLVGRPAKLHKAGLEIMSSMYGRDFEAENDLLASLKLEQYSLEELKQAAVTGRLPVRVNGSSNQQEQHQVLPEEQHA